MTESMTSERWIAAFAERLDVAQPAPDVVDTLLALAGTAAHHSERTAAPIACYLVGLAGTEPARAAEIALTIGSDPA